MKISEALANFVKDALGHGSNPRSGGLSWGIGSSPGDYGHPIAVASHGEYRIHPQYYGSKGHDVEYTKKGSYSSEKLGRFTSVSSAKQAVKNHHKAKVAALDAMTSSALKQSSERAKRNNQAVQEWANKVRKGGEF